jgi:hypothetical protein
MQQEKGVSLCLRHTYGNQVATHYWFLAKDEEQQSQKEIMSDFQNLRLQMQWVNGDEPFKLAALSSISTKQITSQSLVQ